MKKAILILLVLLFLAPTAEACRNRGCYLNARFIYFLLDESGSMAEKKVETIKAFNDYIASLYEHKDWQYIKFNYLSFNSKKIRHWEVEWLEDTKLLTEENYVPQMYTPLYDAIGRVIQEMREDHKFHFDDKYRHKSLCIILTDGLENDSKEYTKADILKMIEAEQRKGATFLYLGANQDAWAEGSSMGITYNYDWDNVPVATMFENLSSATKTHLDGGKDLFEDHR